MRMLCNKHKHCPFALFTIFFPSCNWAPQFCLVSVWCLSNAPLTSTFSSVWSSLKQTYCFQTISFLLSFYIWTLSNTKPYIFRIRIIKVESILQVSKNKSYFWFCPLIYFWKILFNCWRSCIHLIKILSLS